MIVKRGTNPETPPRTNAMQKDQAPKWTRGVRLQTEDFKLHLKPTLPETNMETQRGPYEAIVTLKGGIYGFPC